ncbi:MAG: HAD hydrolase-like protein [Actinobacteria bacterium]|nr:HAD hydrolase-like protein [Actinomycetota bacterium]
MAWVLDLDGVVWLDGVAVAGAANAVARLRSSGNKVLFLTNNSRPTVGEHLSRLRQIGVPAGDADILTSAHAAASMLEPGSSALVCAGPGVTEALTRRGVRAVRAGRVDAVIVGLHNDFDYDRLTAACRAVLNGARLIGTNADPTYPTPTGPIPGGGALLAAVAYATGADPELAGKPNKPVAALVAERVGRVEVVVGDRASTDGRLARVLGAQFALVLSGVTGPDDLPVEPAPDIVGENLASVVAGYLAGA